MIGATISHYTILEKIGGGGMGVVYKAQDTKLKRIVALKFLPADLTRDPEAKTRFIYEAQAASALQDDHICTIHDIDETDDGRMFICMDFYEGETLKKKIERGPLSIGGALDLAIQIARGLAKAHEAGMVHRDIKPANVIITNDGVAKILDFGLAKLAGQAKLTKTGSTVGTAAYMSPEQARGLDVDHRTDTWSLGVVLYEMLTGKLPFRGEHEAALLYSIVHEEPQPISSFRVDLPPDIELSITKMLQKEPGGRFQHMRELLSQLGTIKKKHETESEKALPSIAVLPFVNMSADPENEYFSDGLSEEIINALSKLEGLHVTARTSAFRFRGKDLDMREIGRQLSVSTVLEGSVRKAGNRLRITAQLIDAESDAHIWADKYSGTLDDVFEIQEKVSRSIVDSLKLKLTAEECRKIAERPIENVEAYECYLRAVHQIYRFSEDALEIALQYLQNAINVIGDNALLHSAMAFAFWQYVNMGVKQEDYIAKAQESVRKALACDPDFPQAHAMLGFICQVFEGNQRESIRHFKRALESNPDEYLALKGLALSLTEYMGKISEAVPLVERLIQVDPLDPSNYLIQGRLYFYGGEYESAVRSFYRGYQLDPRNVSLMQMYSWSLAYEKRIDEALSIIEQTVKVSPESAFTRCSLLLKYALLNDKDKAHEQITPELRKTCNRDAAFSHVLGVMLARIDERNDALDWIENAVNRGFINYPLLSEKDPWLANLRGEERFKKLMERVKKEWEEFEV
jgi:non-specific serine/threonine protein kinase